MNTYYVEPVQPRFVKECSTYTKENETPIVIELYYHSLIIKINSDEEPVIDLISGPFGENIITYLKGAYPEHEICLSQSFGMHSTNLPDHLRESIKEMADDYIYCSDLDDCNSLCSVLFEQGWVCNNPIELWIYTSEFSVKRIERPPPPPPPVEPDPPYEYANSLEPLEEVDYNKLDYV